MAKNINKALTPVEKISAEITKYKGFAKDSADKKDFQEAAQYRAIIRGLEIALNLIK